MQTLQIDPVKYYSASRIIKNGWLPWIQSSMTFLTMLQTEDRAKELYKPITRTKGLQTRYLIKGQTLLNVIKLADEGKLNI